MRTRHKALLACVALSAALCVAGDDAGAQGKEKSHGDKHAAPAQHGATARRETVTPAERRVVVRHDAPRVVRVERVRPARVERVKVVHAKPGHGKKVVTTDRAIVVTREVLVKHGYEVVRVETIRGTRVVYYRRGNMGRGRGKGPIVRMVIRPVEERVVFESAPRGLLAEINVRLGM